jgi:hypothetical protein
MLIHTQGDERVTIPRPRLPRYANQSRFPAETVTQLSPVLELRIEHPRRDGGAHVRSDPEVVTAIKGPGVGPAFGMAR